MKPKVFVHARGDNVGVAVEDLAPGEAVGVVILEDDSQSVLTVQQAIPVGHKVALQAIAAGERVIEYGEPIGRATQAIRAGEHVHVHNIKTLRWAIAS